MNGIQTTQWLGTSSVAMVDEPAPSFEKKWRKSVTLLVAYLEEVLNVVRLAVVFWVGCRLNVYQ